MREMTDRPTASIVIPTHGRPEYLDVTLTSITPQAGRAGAEVIVTTPRRRWQVGTARV
jgi:GT2 family glycosyltransferase